MFSNSDSHVGFQTDSGGRSTMDIIATCTSTLVSCVYSSVHFDVPHGTSHRLTFFEKIRSKEFWLELYGKFSFWLLGLLAPEMLVIHAYYEHMIAREDVIWMKRHGYPDWKMVHAFFADMGGFTVEDGERPHSGYELHKMLSRGEVPGMIDCKELEYDIADRTKVDMLFKLFTILQVCRFFAETIWRPIVSLPVSPLEIVTCAYVMCTLMYYSLWLYKPYNVNERIVVRSKPGLRRTWMLKETTQPKNEHTKYRFCSVRYLLDSLSSIFLEPRLSEEDRLGGSKKMYQSSPYMQEGSVIAAIAGFLVGLAHLSSWNVEFPDSNGQALWRICSIAVTVLPLIAAGSIYGAAMVRRDLVTELMNLTVLTLSVTYCTARLILFILLGYSFWSLPAGVYDTKPLGWLNDIPFFH
ncbi:uncharacterized protein FOMMEDRAFT_112880 [Fomitiporia mediterranea MF3/22]|uniref:uncharacterized protein n=1 Tax=Fomitiporia mediterranea (strain MF3/22) TaxID=694068 RepID=UPI00044073EC|nr:uncharacterized protein FOMMEDRAFT_112880 [Fomitiporia mediterranea MF3/22]EJC99831.1 hypothetical protein FOMMEDRAFT_112880 [Fomitiporia mediterranea MF3/22]